MNSSTYLMRVSWCRSNVACDNNVGKCILSTCPTLLIGSLLSSFDVLSRSRGFQQILIKRISSISTASRFCIAEILMHMNTGTVVSSHIIAATAGRLGSSSGFSGILDVLLLPVDIILFIKASNGNRTHLSSLEGWRTNQCTTLA